MICENLSRRDFLKLTGAGALAGALPLTVADVVRAGALAPRTPGQPIVVLVTLYGGNDGLNTVVPYEDPVYYSSRPGISVAQGSVLPLADGLGLNGSMTGFQSLWASGNLTIVRGVSYPSPNLSHFASMAIWQSASPLEAVSSGWIGRWLDTQPHNPMLAIAIGSVLPPLLAGVKQSGSVLPLGGLVLPTGTSGNLFESLGQRSGGDSALQGYAAVAVEDLFSLSRSVQSALATPAPTPANLSTANVGLPSLSQQLDVVATLIATNAPTRVWEVSIGGFDTHADEVTAQTALVGGVAGSVNRFLAQIAGTAYANDVTVLVYSEFGRRVKANASLGTDHGSAGPVFLAGRAGAGGFVGDEPSLSQLDPNGNLAVTTDFRDVYGAILEDLLGAPVDQIIPGWTTKLPIFSA
ncbi:MAG: DUF1501 domain-containing protein [Acidimicrobiales bacterium]